MSAVPKMIDALPSIAEVSEAEKARMRLGIFKDQARQGLLDAASAMRRAQDKLMALEEAERVMECDTVRTAVALILSRL
jgi:hypothetical protein